MTDVFLLAFGGRGLAGCNSASGIFSNVRFTDAMSASKSAVIASSFTINNKSIFSGHIDCTDRSASRIRRLARLRATAVLKIFVDVTKPTFVLVLFCRKRNVKNGPKTALPFWESRAKSLARRKRTNFGSIRASFYSPFLLQLACGLSVCDEKALHDPRESSCGYGIHGLCCDDVFLVDRFVLWPYMQIKIYKNDSIKKWINMQLFALLSTLHPQI